jgi:hypothetical protein
VKSPSDEVERGGSEEAEEEDEEEEEEDAEAEEEEGTAGGGGERGAEDEDLDSAPNMATDSTRADVRLLRSLLRSQF